MISHVDNDRVKERSVNAPDTTNAASDGRKTCKRSAEDKTRLTFGSIRVGEKTGRAKSSSFLFVFRLMRSK